jgi:putative ABC transport system permease protein
VSHSNVDAWVNAHHDAVPGVRLQNADDLAAGFKQFLTTFGIFLTFFAGITLFVGAFLIYLTLSMAVIERTRMYGTLRALGATRKQVRRVVLREATALCLVSIVAGLVLGLGLAVVLLKLIGTLFDIALPGLVVTPGAVIGAIVTGLAVTVISALVPARRAGRLSPVEAMKGDYARDTRLGRAWIAGAAILAAATALNVALSGSQSGAGSLVVIFVLLGAVLVVPLLLRPLALLLGRITNRMARGVGDVAVLHLAKERSRSAYTLALVMVVMAMLFTTGGLYLSVRAAATKIVDRQFGADLFIRPRTPGHAGLEQALARRPDISAVTAVGYGQTSAVNTSGSAEDFFVRVVDPKTYFGISSFFWKDGDDASAERALARGHAVLISDEISTRLDVHRGQQVRLLTAKGREPFDVAGVYIAPPGPPEISMGAPDGRAYLNAGEPFAYLANVRKGTDAHAVASSLRRDFPQQKLAVQTSADAKAQARTQIGTYFKIVYAILLIAAIVGLLGLANTLAMSVLQRFREIGILRAIGVTRSQTWRMVLVESSTMGLTAFILSFPLAWLLTFMVVRATSSGFGFAMRTVYPWLWIPAVAAFGIVISVVATIAPGRRAARLQVVTALQYE